MALLEAEACGVPIVSFDVGGNSSIIETGRNGFLVPLLDIDNLIEAAVKLLCGGVLKEMQHEAVAKVSRSFDCESITTLYNQLFSSLKS
jgi:glycosyltransferase involved in cell wall biosynthesis